MSRTRWQHKAPDWWLKQNDTAPAIAFQLFSGAGTPVDLTGATVKLIAYLPGAASPKINAAATITEQATGKVSYTLQAADVDTVGDYLAEFQVTFSGGAVESFPNSAWLKIRITDDLA